jgi:hypothetical protein
VLLKEELYRLYRVSRVTMNRPISIRRLFRVVTNAFPAAVVAYCCGLHVKLDTTLLTNVGDKTKMRYIARIAFNK